MMPSQDKPRKVTIGIPQFACSLSPPSENVSKVDAYIQSLSNKGAQIICLPELFNLPYFCQKESHQYFSYAEKTQGQTIKKLSSIAKKRSVVLIAPIFEKRASGLYHNTAVVIDADGTLLGYYRKTHIPHDPYYYEKFYFTPGDTGFKVFSTKYAKVGVLICWDQWFPEAARITALKGADIIVYPTAIGSLIHGNNKKEKIKERQSWITIQRSHAIANGVFVASANRVGTEQHISFWGSSFVANPFGEILASAGEGEEQLLAECNLSIIDHYRERWPFLRDRRTDLYSSLNKTYLET